MADNILIKDGGTLPRTVAAKDVSGVHIWRHNVVDETNVLVPLATSTNQATQITAMGGVAETAPASDTASSGLNGRLQRIAQRITSMIALLPTALGQGTMAQSLRVVLASDQTPTPGWAFDVVVTPTVTSGAYSANDIIGALLTFSNCARVADEKFLVTGVQIVSKAAVLPNLTLVLFSADPTATTKTDNAAYSLAAADAFKVIKSIPLGSGWFDHGTPNSISVDGINVLAAPVSGTRDIYGLLIDATGTTLTSTTDIQVRLRGVGV